MHPDTEGQSGEPTGYEPPPGDGPRSGYAAPPGYGPRQGYAAPPGYGPPPGYAQPPGYAPPGYGAPPYGTPGYGPSGYGVPSYGVPSYGVPPYGSAGYGQPGPNPYAPPPGYGYGWSGPLPTTWPYGPDRPGIATAAAVLGFVTGGLTLLMSIFFVAALVSDGADAITAVLLLGIPCAVGVIVGGVRLLARRSHQLLLTSAVAAALVLVLALVVGAATSPGSGEDLVGAVIVFLFAGALPVTTAALAAQRTVSSWVAAAAPN